ncbi:MAG TPA: zinc ABC transporter substrate-binding protein [Ohtaekwangia sp.]|nr:zinc ABC transporter substrate-binding protein [Ohtaekwangia sp.]
MKKRNTIFVLNDFTFRYLIVVLCLVVVLCGCSGRQNNASSGKLQVLTTTGMIADAVHNIAQDRVTVQALMGPGVDPHLYKATHGDLEKITSADIIFYNGLHLEGKMGEVFRKVSRTRPVIAVTSRIDEKLLRDIPGFEGTHDPHVWFDVQLWQQAVKTVSETLIQHDSINTEFYRENTTRYLNQLDSLHEAVKAAIQAIPQQQRVLITAHDAFGYFGDAYQIEVRGLQGISTVSEFGLKDVTELVNFIIARKIKAIFVETSVSHKSIEAVLEGCRQKGWDINIGGSLFSDAMGESGTDAGDYIGMVNANVQTITTALK